MPRGILKVASGLAGVWMLALSGSAQEQDALPAFPSQVEVVTLDVVVVDKQGRPVSGLAAADFTVFEEGRPQVVVAFEAIDLKSHRGAVPAGEIPRPPSTRAAPSASSQADAKNPQPGSPQSERTFAFLIDDLGLDLGSISATKKAIAQWLNEKSWPGDDITVLTTSGNLSWNDRVATGREALLSILGRVQGGRPKAQFILSEEEAYQILETAVGDRHLGGPGGDPGAASGIPTLMDRLVRRAVSAGACIRDCEIVVRTTARETHDRVVRSTRAVLASVERLSILLAPRPGRKSIVVFSEGFARGMGRGEDDAALRASQTANTAVHLVDAQGLVGDAFFSTEFKGAPDPRDLGLHLFDGGILEGAYLAEATGGQVLRNTNDLASGLERIADESSIYYRLGYLPERAPDGRWRKLKVGVRQRKLEVRTRRGYFASPVLAAAAPAPTPSPMPPRPAMPMTTTPVPPSRPLRPSAPIPRAEPAGIPTPDPALAPILEKAGEYVVGYGEAFRDIVAEESFIQREGGIQRSMRSDLVFIGVPGPIPWTCFRDVFEVDGQSVREHESRLEKLFVSETRASAMRKARAILTASAQYNLGTKRTVDVPTLPLVFLRPENQHRFHFERKGRRRVGDEEAVEIAFTEVERPTLVTNGERRDVPDSGLALVNARDGIVLRTEIHLNPSQTIAYLVTDYRFDAGLGIWLPAEMTEQYRDPRNNAIDSEATARYAKYRRLGVTTEESVTLPQK